MSTSAGDTNPSPNGSEQTSTPPSNCSSPLGDSRAPLGMPSIVCAYDPSLDGTSVASNVSDGVRPTDKTQLSEETIAVILAFNADRTHFASKVTLISDSPVSSSQYQEGKCFPSTADESALDLYTLSINLNPFDATVWCNRSAVRLKREEHGLAIMDTSDDLARAIDLDPKYVKAYFRRATAQLSIMKPQLAIKDFKKVIAHELISWFSFLLCLQCMALDPTNAAAKVQLDATMKLVRRLEFEKAIASEDEEATSQRIQKLISEGACELDNSYSGPILEKTANGWKPSLKFVEEMLEWFKAASLTEYTIPNGETCDVYDWRHPWCDSIITCQFFDVLHLLSLTGLPSETHALVFNGDFVDRGSWSTEVVLTVFALKWYMPHKVFLNRGNHETADMNKVYGFEGEVGRVYPSAQTQSSPQDACFTGDAVLTRSAFNSSRPRRSTVSCVTSYLKKYSVPTFVPSLMNSSVPLCCLVTASQQPEPSSVAKIPAKPFVDPQGRKRFFIVHGGLFSRDEVTFEELRKIPRMVKKQPGNEGLMMECLWTDPQDAPGRGPSKRGVGLGFGPDITENWCRHASVTAVIRSHEVRDAGYSIEHEGRCITVFSAPNYVDQVGNQGGFVRINEHGTLQFTSFKHQPHPNVKPMAYAGGFMGLGGLI
ncbi:serine/threonine-protein phosphatase [Puccinia sorghi]|uniref:Serine/threonine-protein phosphatase n=1 Tax=Puccinia sorghi TaxID=27349 RepID=A0A0L6V6V3_9BASI|nr:serine/threonine-protein phosphatase [Puccinia sorghi]